MSINHKQLTREEILLKLKGLEQQERNLNRLHENLDAHGGSPAAMDDVCKLLDKIENEILGYKIMLSVIDNPIDTVTE
jgi:hypothetical protein